jgi:hypothetical protein
MSNGGPRRHLGGARQLDKRQESQDVAASQKAARASRAEVSTVNQRAGAVGPG